MGDMIRVYATSRTELVVGYSDDKLLLVCTDQDTPGRMTTLTFSPEAFDALRRQYKEHLLKHGYTVVTFDRAMQEMTFDMVEQTPCPECGQPKLVSVANKNRGGWLSCKNCEAFFDLTEPGMRKSP